jgi:hypothetical protein
MLDGDPLVKSPAAMPFLDRENPTLTGRVVGSRIEYRPGGRADQ